MNLWNLSPKAATHLPLLSPSLNCTLHKHSALEHSQEHNDASAHSENGREGATRPATCYIRLLEIVT
ncbi:hypothetical protein J6590_041556 [Homalodisca vitripennis]|nr:hypothetical protein J6590_041556 [Homalodisca vitripennis]